ncbi:MAG: hypothetical protein U0441_06220 [Polyangiaceae bacterium]
MRKSRFGAVSLAILGLCGCGPAPAPQPPPTPTASVKPVETAAPTASVAAGPDLSPVAEPSDVVAIARWKSPIATASNLASCAGVAPVIVEVNARMAVNMVLQEVLRRPVDVRKVASLVALDAPVDVVASLDPGAKVRPPMVAVAMGLTSLDSAKVAITPEGQEPAEITPGLWGQKGKRGIACGVAASAGATPARLVCAESEKSLEALAPYLARTAPSVDLGTSDMRFEGRFDVLKKRYPTLGPNYLKALSGALVTEYGSSGDKRFDGLAFEAASAVQDDVTKLWGDLHRVTIDAKTETRGACLRATANVDLASTSSFIAGTLTDRMARSGPPPAIYWRQPADSQGAFYGRGVDSSRFTGVLGKARDLLSAAMATENFASAADRTKIAQLLDLPFGKDTHVVVSHGPTNVPMPADTTKANAVKASEAMLQRMVGWTLIGADEGPAAMKKQLKAWVDAYKSASVQASLKKELGPTDAKSLPVVKTGGAPASLGAGAEQVEISIPNLEAPFEDDSKQGQTRMTAKLYIFVMGDGDNSWLAFGAAKDEVVKRLLAVKQGADDKGQLGARAGLDTLKNGKQMFGGFVSASLPGDKVGNLLSGLALASPQFMNADDLKLAQSLLSLPNKGMTPVVLTENASANGTMTRLDIGMEMQQGTFEDMKALVVGSYGFFSRLGILP